LVSKKLFSCSVTSPFSSRPLHPILELYISFITSTASFIFHSTWNSILSLTNPKSKQIILAIYDIRIYCNSKPYELNQYGNKNESSRMLKTIKKNQLKHLYIIKSSNGECSSINLFNFSSHLSIERTESHFFENVNPYYQSIHSCKLQIWNLAINQCKLKLNRIHRKKIHTLLGNKLNL